MPYLESDEDKKNESKIDNEYQKPTLIEGNGKDKDKDKDKNKSEYYTGNKSKKLLVHVMQDGIEVDKPVKAKIFEQSVEWRRRQWPIIPDRFTYDYEGIAHQYVEVNDVSVLSFQKDHENNCKKCGGKMTVDARESRALGRRGVFQAIWGLDNTHMILMIVILISAMAMAGGFFWAYSDNTKHMAQLEASTKEIARLNNVVGLYQNATGITIGK